MALSGARRSATRVLKLETLEPRQTMAASIIASLNRLGVLSIEGTAGNDQIVVSQASNKISVKGVGGAFDVTKIQSIAINTLGGNDTVQLNGLATTFNRPITVTNGAGTDLVTSIGGTRSALAVGTFTRTATGKTTVTAAATTTTTAPQPTTTKPPTDWFDANIRDAALRSLLKSDFADKIIDRREMLDLFEQVAADRIVSSNEFADLTAVANNQSLFTSMEYVGVLTRDVVLGSVANATYQGTTLGNLKANVNAAHLEKLVNKWFLGQDRPVAHYGSTNYAYANASGSLYGSNGPSYTDVRQGMVGDCYFVATLGEVALRTPSAIRNMFIANGDGTYTVRFFNNGKADYVTVDSKLPVDQFGRFVFANMGSSAASSTNVLWVALAEKAYAQMNASGWVRMGLPGNGSNSYQAIAGGYFSVAATQIVNRTATTSSISGSTFEQFKTAFDGGKLVGFATTTDPVASNLVGGHQYVAISYNATARSVTLFNPWGLNNGSAYSGLVTLSWTSLAGNFSYWDRA